MLEAGSKFPDFALPNQDGKVVRLADFPGQWVLVYFYPKDDTPGCSVEGRSFSVSKPDFDAAGIKVLGVSADDVASHKSFCNKFSFTIDLLADPKSKLMKACKIPKAQWRGMKFWERTTFVIDPAGVVRKVYAQVDPQGHDRAVLDDIKAMRQ